MLEAFSFQQSMTCFMVLFAVIDILCSVPIIVSLHRQFGKIESERATIVSGLIMLLFLFVGDKMLKFMGLDINSFAIAGSFVIFVIALEMILGIEIHKVEKAASASIIPIAFPLVAGAGTLTTTLSLRAEFHVVNIIVGILLNTIVVYVVLKSADYLERKIGDGTLMVLKKVFGIVLLAISIKLFTANFAQLFSSYVKLDI